jgi:hypothetical protein
MRVVNMMGDTNVETVRRHYFNFQYEEDEQMIDGWQLPQFDAAEHVRQVSELDFEITN